MAKMRPDAALPRESRGVLTRKRRGRVVNSFRQYCSVQNGQKIISLVS